MLIRKLEDLGHKPIIGMIHLASNPGEDPVERALQELEIFEKEGVDGAIIEDYYGSPQDVARTLEEIFNLPPNLFIGVNMLRNPYVAFELADKFGARFIQFDSVKTSDLDLRLYESLRGKYPKIAILGGVRFKGTQPTGSPLEQDLEEAKQRCEAIVTTGSGTGIETPVEKLREFRRYLPDFPLIVGAGVTIHNVSEQLAITDGAIIGSYFKLDGYTRNPINRIRVRYFMENVEEIRA